MSSPAGASDTAGGQAERTALAWTRTLITMAAVIALVAIHANVNDLPALAVVTVMVVSGGLLLSTSAVARRVWLRAMAGLEGRSATASARATAVVATTATAVGLWALLSILTSRQG
jgi:hypothetical protein